MSGWSLISELFSVSSEILWREGSAQGHLGGAWELFVMSFGLRGEQSAENEVSDSLCP